MEIVSGMSEPEIVFSPWKPWSEREDIDVANRPGVYLLAHFAHGIIPQGRADPLDPNIVYIGETHGRTLAERWREFSRSAETGKKAHAGGRSYHKTFKKLRDDLYVAAFSPNQPDWTSRCFSFFIRYVEWKLIWDYARRHKADKLCNKE